MFAMCLRSSIPGQACGRALGSGPRDEAGTSSWGTVARGYTQRMAKACVRLSLGAILGGVVTPTLCLAQEKLVVPPGVRYKEAPPEVNSTVRSALSELFAAPYKVRTPRAIFADRMVLCGPLLWAQIKTFPEMKGITAGQVEFRVPIGREGEPREARLLEGKLFQTPEEVAALWSAVLKTIGPKEKFIIRRANPAEIKLYWAMVPYDLEEPIFVAQSTKHAFLVDLVPGPDGAPHRISFIDDYRVLSSGLPKRAEP